MKKSRFTETQIVSILKQAAAGLPLEDTAFQLTFGKFTISRRKADLFF